MQANDTTIRTMGAGRAVATLLLLTLLGALLAAPPAAAAARQDVPTSVTVIGADQLLPGQSSSTSLVIRAATDVAADTPLRIVARVLDRDGRADAAVSLASGDQLLVPDAAGFVILPPTDQPPLTVGTHPQMGTAEGLAVPLAITVPDRRARTIEVVLADTGERPIELRRLSGDDRIGTAAAISRATFPDGAIRAYVARADDFPDALTAGPAAGQSGSPILLVGATLPTVTEDELVRLGVDEVVVLGGDVAVTPEVVAAIELATGATSRRLAGADRFATAAAVALDSTTGPVDVALIATGRSFADALSGGAAAAAVAGPLLLVEPETVPTATADALRQLAPACIVVLGGSAAVADVVLEQLAALTGSEVVRVAGADRYATSAAIAREFFPTTSTRGTGPDGTVVFATGSAFPDALAGTVLAVDGDAPMLLIAGDVIPDAVAQEVRRLEPDSASILGGTAAVGPDAEAAVRQLLSGDLPPRSEWDPVASSGPVPLTSAPEGPGGGGGGVAAAVVMGAPTTAQPQQARPGGRFSVSLTSQMTGTYVVRQRLAGTTVWQDFPNGTATGTITPGANTIGLNAPLGDGAYDLQVVATPGTRQTSTTITMPNAVVVTLRFPPPLISDLVEGLTSQPQLIAVRPAGGLADGVRLDVDLGSAERGGADYPLDGTVIVEGGTGTAVLEVTRDAVARIVYTAGAGDDEGAPTPLLRFRIEGIATDEVHQGHAGQFFRYDIMHGVRRVFAMGSGSSIASPTVSDVLAGSPHTFQTIAFSLRDPLPPFHRVDVDLSAGQQSGAVDYSEGFAVLQGDDPHGGHGTPALGSVFLDVGPDRAVLTIVAGPQGIPTVQPEGPVVNIFIGGLAIGPEPQRTPVTFTRSDTGASTDTTFSSSRRGFASFQATNLEAAAVDQTQELTLVLEGSMDPGNGFEVGLPRGVDYRQAAVEVVEGSGTAQVYGFSDQWWVNYESSGDADATSIVLRLAGVATDALDRTLIARAYRFDGGDTATALFDVGAGTALAGVYADRLPDDGVDLFQTLSYTPTTAIEPGQTVTIDLSEGEAGLVAHDPAGAGEVFVDGIGDPGSVALEVVPDVSAVLTHTAGEEGIPAGATVYLSVSGLRTDAGQAVYPVIFTAPDGRAATTTFEVGPLPGLTGSTASDLAADAVGLTQTITTTVVGDMGPFEIIEMGLSGEAGGVRYTGARAVVMDGVDGTAELSGFPGDFAYVTFRAGPAGLTDGTVLRLELRGVNTDDVNESHAVDLYRYDGFNGDLALYDVGEGSPFVGRPFVGDLLAGQTDQYQSMSMALSRDLAEGDTIEVDLSAAQAAGVDYSGAFVDDSPVEAVFETGGGVARLVLTVGPEGLPAGAEIFVAIGGITTPAASGVHQVAITAGADSIITTFEVFQGHGGGHGG